MSENVNVKKPQADERLEARDETSHLRTGYSLAGCSSAEPVSASPDKFQYNK